MAATTTTTTTDAGVSTLSHAVVADALAALASVTVTTADALVTGRDYVAVSIAGTGAVRTRKLASVRGAVRKCGTVSASALQATNATADAVPGIWAMAGTAIAARDVAGKLASGIGPDGRTRVSDVRTLPAYVVDAGSVSAARAALVTLLAGWYANVGPVAPAPAPAKAPRRPGGPRGAAKAPAKAPAK